MSYTGKWGTSDSAWGNIVWAYGAPVTTYNAVDTLTATDAATASASYTEEAVDTLTATDNTYRVRLAQDTLSITEDADNEVFIGVVDTLVATEAAKFAGGSFLSANAFDAIFAEDKAIRRFTKHFEITETLTTTEGALASAYIPAEDDLTVSDSVSGYTSEILVDYLTVTDKAQVAGRSENFAEDFLTVYDSNECSHLTHPVASDTLTTYEELTKKFAPIGLAEDTLSVSDHLIRDLYLLSATDTVVWDDELVADPSKGAAAYDTLLATETQSAAGSYYVRSASDTLIATDEATGELYVKGFAIFPDLNNPNVLRFELPEPEFNNSEHSTNRMQRYRSETGVTYTYAQSSPRARVYSYSFAVDYDVWQALETYLWNRGQQPPSAPPQANLNLYIRFRADLYRVKLITNTLSAVHVSGRKYRVTLEYEGVRIRYGGGRRDSC